MEHANIEAVWLYGSQARNDANDTSDLDVLVLGDADADVDPEGIQHQYALPSRPDIAFYTREGISALVRRGSLFAWHLKLEARPLWDSTGWLLERLVGLAAFREHREDLRELCALLESTRASLRRDALSCVFDAGQLASVARNAAVLLSHYDGNPDFSPRAPERLRFHTSAPFPLSEVDFAALRACRCAAERGAVLTVIDDIRVGHIGDALAVWLQQIAGYFDEGSRNVQ